jgi:hypothetical protein
MWQQQWTNTGKGAAFFPLVRNRLKQGIRIIPEFTTMVPGHGKLKPYLYRFGLLDISMCLCEEEEEEETVDHLIVRFKELRKQRNELTRQIKNTGGNWPTTNETLVNNYLQIFVRFVKSIDFTDL